ncbi:diguanylate cyclase [Microvirga tunisiensis]|uniref:diguanylate cyclase n=2 Tax=Pannonibacter tanglangensis TaxID=2750084 RepID=A0A7X5F3A3_9HYPH|nr:MULTISPECIES: GGDEF domain-containing protein [unclassified Pannonibacter]NBN64451.1 diguanylate cyclase [Pannonibacter sp. XCT-34]NBN78983.1 diguanylate cyclase [Pannonibacter sp. XCT-53]
MRLDVVTLNAALTVMQMVGAGMLFFVWRFSMHKSGSQKDSIRLWSMALLMVGFGMLLLSLRGQIPDAISIVVGNGLVLGGMGMRIAAISTFWRISRYNLAAFLPTAVWLLLCLYPPFYESYLARSLYQHLALTATSATAIYLSVTLNTDGIRAARWLSWVMTLELLAQSALFIGVYASGMTRFEQALSSQIFAGYILWMIMAVMATIICAFAMVIEREERYLRDQARRDPLTGLANRRDFFESVRRWIETAGPERSYAVALFDLDEFKSVNDRYGHAMGDEMLLTFAACCNQLRGADDIVGRLGGEEFVVFLPDSEDICAFEFADRLRQRFAAEVRAKTGGILITTTSAGIHAGSTSGQSLDAVMAHADEALYAAKRSGRNRVMRAPAAEPDLAVQASHPRAGGALRSALVMRGV